jgi:two-component system phosphate regulon sensor histidine kinase PhoR
VRRDFVANVSHELRTPLTAIQGFAETLLAGAIDDRENRVRFLEIIRDHSKRLARLTDDLLKLSRIEADQMQLDLRPVGVAELIAGCLETTHMRAEQKQLSLESECPGDLPPVKGDRGRLGEVLQNLLDNAVQYTPPNGRIRVSAIAQEGEVVFTVSDNGIGIPHSDQSRIFERFYRVDAARSRELGGTGLGLAIARHIVEAHGGRIWVESTVGQGSDFQFSIPAAA